MHSPQLWAALQNRLTAGLCHCDCAYQDLLFIQVCSDHSPRHCSTVQSKMHPPLLSAALQTRLTAGLCHCKLHLGSFGLHTGVQRPNTSALQHYSRQNAFPTALGCSAKQAHSRLVSLQIHLSRFALHTGVQRPNTNALQDYSRQNAFPTALG